MNLRPLKTADARAEVCQDRNNVIDHGFEPTSFAYPFGTFDAGTQQVVKDCGYNSGRGVSGVDDTKTFAETIPPLDPMRRGRRRTRSRGRPSRRSRAT